MEPLVIDWTKKEAKMARNHSSHSCLLLIILFLSRLYNNFLSQVNSATMSTSRGYHEYIGGIQYIGGYHEYIGGCLGHWGFQYKLKGFCHLVGGYHEYIEGGYHEYIEGDTMSTQD